MRRKVKSIGLVVLGVVAGILVSLNVPAIADKTAPAPLPLQELRAFTEVFGAIKADYVEPVPDKKLLTGAINGMVSTLDPHSGYLDKQAFRELQVGTQGQFGGLGIEVGMEDGFLKVISPIEGTPAYRAGIKPGDLIVKINDTPVKGMTLHEAVNRMRGKPGTKITITIARKGATAPIVVTLTRAIIKVQSVRSKMIEPGYGWVRVSQFQEATADSVAKQIDALYRHGPLKGVVLDLRNDPGGLLYSAVGVAAAFLPENSLVVSTKGRIPDANKKYFAIPNDYLHSAGDNLIKDLPSAVKTVPMVVLVNGGSASASEIVAGALKDHKRATVMGTQTFGKGSVQTIMPLGDGTALRLTTAEYYTPNGDSIQLKGITPNIVVEEPGEGRPMLREEDLRHHLPNPLNKNAAVEGEEAVKEQTVKMPKLAKPITFGSKQDFQLYQAIAFLKGEPVRGKPGKPAAPTKSGS